MGIKGKRELEHKAYLRLRGGSLLKTNQVKKPIPTCYGLHFDKDAPECMGGHDAAFTDEDGGHVRGACDHVSACAARCQANRQNVPQVVPTSGLYRPPAPPTTFTQPSAVAAQPYRPPMYPGQSYQPTHGQPQYHPPVGLAQMVPVNYSMPQYLTIREPSNGQGLVRRLGKEVLRSMGKSFGHTLAHFFDVEPFGNREG